MKSIFLNKRICCILFLSLMLFACESISNKENPILGLKKGVWKPVNHNQTMPFFFQDGDENSTNIIAPIWIVDDNPTYLEHYAVVIEENIVQQNDNGEWIVIYNNNKNRWLLSKSPSADTLYCTTLTSSGSKETIAYVHLENQLPPTLMEKGGIEGVITDNIWITSTNSTNILFTKLLARSTDSKKAQLVRLVVKKEEGLFTEDRIESVSLKKQEENHFLVLSEGLFYIQGFEDEKNRIKLAPLNTRTVMNKPIYWTKLDSAIVHLDSLVKVYEDLDTVIQEM